MKIHGFTAASADKGACTINSAKIKLEF